MTVWHGVVEPYSWNWPEEPMDIVEMLTRCGDSISNEAAQVIRQQREELAILQEQFQVSADRAQSWRNLCEHWKELAEARGEALALRDKRGPCGFRNHAADCDCQGAGGDR